MAFSTRIKLQLNELLNPVGLQIGTTTADIVEKNRIQRLESNGHWETARYDQGLDFKPDEYLRFLSETCLPFKEHCSTFAKLPTEDDTRFYLENGYFQSVDAEFLYSLVRSRKPANIIEVGSGFSTLLISQALADGQLTSTLTSVDPAPRADVESSANRYIKNVVEETDPQLFIDSLKENDILFIDSSHYIVTGGDVPFLMLEVLPRLKKGVLIHIHDIFFPLDYPKEWKLRGWNWNEQYLIHAFLAFNTSFKILWPAHYMWEYHRDEILKVIPADPLAPPPSSLWLIRN